MKYLVREIKYREHLDEAINEGRIQAIPVDKLSDVLGVLAKKDVPMTDLEDYMIGIKDALKLGLDYNELLKVLENAFNPDELNAWVYHNSDKDAYNNLYPDDEYKKVVNESKEEDKKKLGAFVKLNAGDVEEGNKIFNKNCGNECSEGEAMTEAIDATPDMLDQAYKGSYYTITGAGGAIEDWEKGYQELLNKEQIGQIKEWITFKGQDMNDKYHLEGTVAYPDDLTFLAFPLDGLDVGKLAMFKLKMGDRWFDDIVDNNSSNMNEGLTNKSFSKVLEESIELKEAWERRISKELAFKLRDAIENEDKEALANSFKEVVNYININFSDLVEDDYEFSSLQDDAEVLGPEDDDDQFDYALERLYDYLDSNKIWLPIQALDESFSDNETDIVLEIADLIKNESVDLLENFKVHRFSIIAGDEEGQTESVYDGEYIEETIYKYDKIKDNYNICYIYDNEDGEKIEQEEIDSWRSAMEQETGSDFIELDEDLFDEVDDKDEFLRDLAKEDYEDGNVYDIDDFEQFKQICSECGQEVDEDDFDTYFEYVNEIREEDVFKDDDRLDYLRRKEEVMPLDKEERYELTFGSEDDEDLEEDLNDQMIDQINDRDANYEADKETTREVRKELAKQGIATNEEGEPINETINVREALNDMDKELDQPHLLNLYDAISLSVDEKKELVEMISTKKGVKQISKYLNSKYKLDEDIEEEEEDIEDISHLVFDVHVGNGKFIEEFEVSSIDEIDHYFKLIKDTHEAEMFNYHSDYWGSAEDYQNQNISLIESLSPYVGKKVYIEYEDGYIKGTLLGIAIDTQYNSISHTRIILDSIEYYNF